MGTVAAERSGAVPVPDWFQWEPNRGFWTGVVGAAGAKTVCCQGPGCTFGGAANAAYTQTGEQMLRFVAARIPVTGSPGPLGAATYLCPGCAAKAGVCVKCGAASVLDARSFRGLCLDCNYYGDHDDQFHKAEVSDESS